jgi:hypothetical protein
VNARGWVGFVALVVAVAGATVVLVKPKYVGESTDPVDAIDVPTALPPAFPSARPANRRTVVPALVGLHREEAWRKIGDAMLAVEATTEDAGPEKSGVVLSQDPAAGTKTVSGALVKVRVGRTPEPTSPPPTK